MQKKKSKAGRPAKWTSHQEMEKAIDRYFEDCPDTHPTITGLVLFLGFCDKVSFYDYEKKPEFSYCIKKGRTMIEQVYEQLLHKPGCTGAIFALKNFGWRDDQGKEKDDRLEDELEFVNIPKDGNGRLSKFYN